MGDASVPTSIDGHARVACAETQDDETAITAAGVRHRAVEWFADRSVTGERVLSDDGSAYRSYAAAGVTTLAAANAFLPGYLDRQNVRVTVPTADPGLAWLPLPATLDLAHVFCLKHSCTVRPDNTISFQGTPP